MTDTLRAGTALVTIAGREFGMVNAVHDALTDAFAYAGPIRDQIAEEGICRTLVLRIDGLTGEEVDQSLPPAAPFDIEGLDSRQVRARVVTTASDDLQAVMAAISAGPLLVGEPTFGTSGSAVLVVATR